MPRYEYKIVQAPARAARMKGLEPGEDGFTAALSLLVNDLAREHWEYVRAEMLPLRTRSALLLPVTRLRHVLVFRRPAAPLLSQPTAPVAEEVAPEPVRPRRARPETMAAFIRSGARRIAPGPEAMAAGPAE